MIHMRSEAEIRAKLESLRKQYAESTKNPVETFQDRNHEKYFEAFDKRKKQIEIEVDWMSEMAVLEWVLEEKHRWRTTWMIEARS
jgi:hypothetical protein